MKNLFFLLITCTIVFNSVAQNRHDGQVDLYGDNGNGGLLHFTGEKSWFLDNYQSRFRIHSEGHERVSVDLQGNFNLYGLPGSATEGGQLNLHSASGYQTFSLDNNRGWFRMHHSQQVWFAVSPDGRIEAKSIKVTNTPTADFVFEEEYQLPKLSVVEQFITENKHLPEIQSAKDMTENGVIIEEFQIKLLQKIEELTLYTITQQKRLDSQQSVIENLQSEVKQLKQ